MIKILKNGMEIQVESHLQMEDATPTTTVKSPVVITTAGSAVDGIYHGNLTLTVPENATYLNVKADKDLFAANAVADLVVATAKRMRIPSSDYDYVIPVAGLAAIYLRYESATLGDTTTAYFGFVIV